MNPQNKEKKKYIRCISTVDEYRNYIDGFKLTDEEKKICDMIFIHGYSYNFIACKLNYSESSVKRKVKNILNKIS